MAKLTESHRDKLPKSKFGEPGLRKYPMPDKSHAVNAKARATQQEEKGNLSSSEESRIDAKANRILGHREPHEKFHDKMAEKLMK